MTLDSNAAGQNGQNGNGTNGTPRTKVCVYCGASAGSNPAHLEAARQLGKAMAANNIDLGTLFIWSPQYVATKLIAKTQYMEAELSA